MLPLVRISRARVRPIRARTSWRGSHPITSAPLPPRSFATTSLWRSSEAVERPHSSTPQPGPEEKETELNLSLDAKAEIETPSAAGAPAAVEDEDGNLVVPPAPGPELPREVLKGQVYVSNVFPVQLGKFECVEARPFWIKHSIC